jgi:hypothetical protein
VSRPMRMLAFILAAVGAGEFAFNRSTSWGMFIAIYCLATIPVLIGDEICDAIRARRP